MTQSKSLTSIFNLSNVKLAVLNTVQDGVAERGVLEKRGALHPASARPESGRIEAARQPLKHLQSHLLQSLVKKGRASTAMLMMPNEAGGKYIRSRGSPQSHADILADFVDASTLALRQTNMS